MRFGPVFDARSAALIVRSSAPRLPVAVSIPFGETKSAIDSLRQPPSVGGSIDLHPASASAGASINDESPSAALSSVPASSTGRVQFARSSHVTSVGPHDQAKTPAMHAVDAKPNDKTKRISDLRP